MLAQAEFCPSQIGTIKFTVTWTLDELGLEAFEPGDVLLHDDPYRGSGHVPEHMMLKPVFYNGEIFAFVANVAHMSEPGAKTPGGLSGDATEVFQEGLLLPPVKIKRRGEDVCGHMEDHSRQPPHAESDLWRLPGDDGLARSRRDANSSNCSTPTAWKPCATPRRSSSRSRSGGCARKSARIPNGDYYFEDVIEDDGITDRVLSDALRSDRARRGDHRRLHRFGAAGGRSGQRDLCGHRVGDLQRLPAPDRSDDSAQRRAATARSLSSPRPARL